MITTFLTLFFWKRQLNLLYALIIICCMSHTLTVALTHAAHEQILQCAYNMQFFSYTQKIICCFLVVTCSLHVGLG